MAYIGKIPTAAALTSSDISDGIITNAKLAQDIISGDTALGATPADTDEFSVSDAGTLKRVDYSYIKGGGITQADMYRITTDFNLATSETFITSNWERVDTDFDKIGDGMSESSGVFTFPETGIYLIQVGATIGTGGAGGGRYGEISTHFTTDDSSYTKRAYSQDNQTFGDGETNHFHQVIFDVTNVSTHKVKFATVKQQSSYNYAMRVSSTSNANSFSFIRLGDT